MVTVTIDGITASVPPGTTLLQAARRLGIWIPTLCHHDAVSPYGGCRLCLVEATVNGTTTLVTSCTYEAADNIAVQTNTDRVRAQQRFIMQLLLAEAPQARILQDMARDLGVAPPERFPARNELCIACGLCIRACREIVGVSAIDFARRGYDRVAASPFFQRSEACIGCGTCAAICPTGAIAIRDIPESAKATDADGRQITGPARIIDNWKVSLALKRCKHCGEPFAPEFQLEHFSRQAALPDDFFDVCRQCRT